MIDEAPPFPWRSLLALLSLVLVGSIVDLSIDYRESGGASWHILARAIAALFLLAGMLLLARQLSYRMQMARRSILALQEEKSQFAREHAVLVESMRVAIQDQFRRWQLTPAETQLAEDLIRGYSIEQIAALRGKRSSTVRNQSVRLYARTGMTGRHELAAFFLEDILDEDQSL